MFQPDFSRNKGPGHTILQAELTLQPRPGMVVNENLPIKGADTKLYFGNISVIYFMLFSHVEGGIYGAVGKPARRVWLNRQPFGSGDEKRFPQPLACLSPVHFRTVTEHPGKS